MTRKHLLTICLAILLPAALPAAGTLRFSNFHDQTAMFSVRSIAQQEDGMIWFGTERNLYSFDGYDLLPHPCPDGHIQVNKLLFWGDGLLLGTNGGLYSFSPAASSFRRARPFDGALVRDLQSIGNFVYVATDSGLYRYDPRTETAGRIADGDFITLSAYGQDLYAGKYDGIGIYRTDSGLYAPWFPDLHLHLATRFLDDGDAIWVGTPTQLLHIDKAAGRILAAVPLPVVKSLCRDRDGLLMIGTDNGLFRCDPASLSVEKVLDSVTWASLEDRSGDLWFGTEDGLQYLRQSPAIRPVESFQQTGNSQFTALLRDRSGQIWAGGTNGVFLQDTTGAVRHYTISGTPYHIPSNKIRQIVEDPEGNGLYIASDGGALRYDPDTGALVPLRIAGIHNWVYDLIPDRNTLWAATFEGLFQLRRDGSVIARYTREDGLTTDDVARIIRGRQGRIWAMTRDQHIFQVDPVSGEVRPLEPTPEGPDCMCGDEEGRIWVAASNRIFRITPGSTGTDVLSFPFHADDNIESYSLAEAEGRIWICTSVGLFSVGKDGLDIRGLGTWRNYVGIAYDPVLRSLLLGTAGAVDEIRITDLLQRYETSTPDIHITGITVNGTDRIEGRDLPDGGLRLPSNRNHLEISFTDFNYNDEIPRRFAYHLDTRREHGQGIVTGNVISLTALRPGRYRLALAPAGIAAEPAGVLSFKIRQPWYLSPWMIILYICLLGGIIYTIIRLATTRRYLEMERAQRDELVEQSRQKEAFFQDLAHELKTPLSLVIGPLGKMIKEAGPDADLTDLRTAQENAMNLSTLIHKTIDYYKGGGGMADSLIRTDVEFVDFARSIFDSWRENFPGHEFIFSSSHPAIPASVDIVKIETVLNNLLSNACKYTPEGGSVLMTLERDDTGRQLVIKVSDTGIGIPQEEIPYAFQRYFESSRTKQGGYDSTGIGLSVIRKYVEVHGGQVSVDSDANGTTFTVLLPCLAEAAPAGSAGADTAGEDPDKPLIAIVDDNAQICNFLESLLKDEYRCVSSHNGKSGLKLCKDVIPDLIICDVRMPVMDGLEMCRQIRQFAPLSTIPIILLTAKDDRQTEQESIDLNIDVFLPKPFEVPTLTARVKQLLGTQKRMEQRIRMEMLATPEKPRELSQDERFLKKVTQLIEEHLDDADLSVARLCELGDFPEKQLYRKLKQFTGLSAVEYIRSIRLKRAALLLQSGSFTVSEVMYSVGFSNASYFTRAFSAAYNMTPSEYMKSFKNK